MQHRTTMKSHTQRPALAALLLSAAAWLASLPAQAEDAAPPPALVQIKLKWSNVFLLKSATPVLVDAGSPGDMAALTQALEPHRLKPENIALVVLTHGHSDHAGLAAQLQAAGAKVAMAEGDAVMAQAGQNDELKPTNLMAQVLKHFALNPNYPPFKPDLALKDTLDLARWGIRGRVLPMPGHTPGSAVVLLEDQHALVGDMMMGGYFGGAVLPGLAGEHYFQADLAANHRNIHTLLAQGIQTFHLGHGGPVTRASVLRAFPLPTTATASASLSGPTTAEGPAGPSLVRLAVDLAR